MFCKFHVNVFELISNTHQMEIFVILLAKSDSSTAQNHVSFPKISDKFTVMIGLKIVSVAVYVF